MLFAAQHHTPNMVLLELLMIAACDKSSQVQKLPEAHSRTNLKVFSSNSNGSSPNYRIFPILSSWLRLPLPVTACRCPLRGLHTTSLHIHPITTGILLQSCEIKAQEYQGEFKCPISRSIYNAVATHYGQADVTEPSPNAGWPYHAKARPQPP